MKKRHSDHVTPPLRRSALLYLPWARRDDPVYRVISVGRFLELLDHGENTLVRPSEWDDPWENVILKSSAPAIRGLRVHPHEELYAQCWTAHHYSDAMWRVYCPDGDGVRLRSKPGLLVQSLSRAGIAAGRAFIGRVRYLSERRLLDLARQTRRAALPLDPQLVARTLLAKRRCFLHEREVRLLWIPLDPVRGTQRFSYAFDADEVVDQVMLHPLMPKERREEVRQAITQRGFRGRVKASKLYDPPSWYLPWHCARRRG